MKKAALFVAALGAFGASTFVSAAAHAANNVVVRFKPYNDTYVQPENSAPNKPGWMPVEDFAANIEQVLNIGSQSSGAGAGRVTFNPLTFTMAPSSFDARMFLATCAGTPFEEMDVEILNGSKVVQLFRFKLVAVKAMTWVLDKATQSYKVQYTLEFGTMQLATPGANKTVTTGWDRVKNQQAAPSDASIP